MLISNLCMLIAVIVPEIQQVFLAAAVMVHVQHGAEMGALKHVMRHAAEIVLAVLETAIAVVVVALRIAQVFALMIAQDLVS